MWGRIAAAAAITAAALGGAACENTVTETVTVTDTIYIGDTETTFDQVERLGNPLVSEVFLEKREHGHFNTDQPADDAASFRDDIAGFITGVAGRDAAYANAVAAALTPDMLVVRLNRAPGVTGASAAGAASVGWLTYVLDPANGYGGRKLDGDDAVDKGLLVIFGNVLGNNNNVSPGLVTDNVDDNQADLGTFPYVAAPNS